MIIHESHCSYEKSKGLRLKKKVYVYSLLRQDGFEIIHIMQKFCISNGTLFNIFQIFNKEIMHGVIKKLNKPEGLLSQIGS